MSDNDTLPDVRVAEVLCETRLFVVEALDVRFRNGEQRRYERIKGKSPGAVLIVPLLDDDTMLLIREYNAGSHRYELYFPKGKIDSGETPLTTAGRELKEEVGFGARELTVLKAITAAPGFLARQMTVVLAEGLYPARAVGDEPEPIEVVRWPIADALALLDHPEVTEGRSLAALLLMLAHKQRITLSDKTT